MFIYFKKIIELVEGKIIISYKGRTYQEGKKIGFVDVFVAIYCIIRYSIFN